MWWDMCLATALQGKGILDLLFDLEEVVDIQWNRVIIEAVVKIASSFLCHIFKPLIVMLLKQVSFNPPSKFASYIHKPVV